MEPWTQKQQEQGQCKRQYLKIRLTRNKMNNLNECFTNGAQLNDSSENGQTPPRKKQRITASPKLETGNEDNRETGCLNKDDRILASKTTQGSFNPLTPHFKCDPDEPVRDPGYRSPLFGVSIRSIGDTGFSPPASKLAPSERPWSSDEHKSFQKALDSFVASPEKLNNTVWMKMAGMIKTRSPEEIHLHAQQYLEKLQQSTSSRSHKKTLVPPPKVDCTNTWQQKPRSDSLSLQGVLSPRWESFSPLPQGIPCVGGSPRFGMNIDSPRGGHHGRGGNSTSARNGAGSTQPIDFTVLPDLLSLHASSPTAIDSFMQTPTGNDGTGSSIMKF